MELDDWRSLNYFTADITAYLLFIVSLFCLYKYQNLDRQFRYLAYYLMVCSILEFLAKVFLRYDKPQEYFTWVNHIYVSAEALLIGLFIYTNLKSKTLKKVNVLCIIIILLFQLRVFLTQPLLDSQYSSALLASIFSIFLLFALFDYSNSNYKSKFYQQPNILVLLSFLVAYLILLIIYWFLPLAIEYSRILANIMIIIKNIIGIFFYLTIAYCIKKIASKKKIIS